MSKKPSFTIIVDTREQLSYDFQGYPCKVIWRGLKTADYSILGYEDQIAIERKSKEDLYGSFGGGRERFEREFKRLSKFEYAALVIEASLKDILVPPELSRMSPRSVIQSVLSWSIRYNVHMYFADNRKLAECLIYSLFDKFLYNKTRKESVAA